MKNRISLSIPKPCHEKWENLLPTHNGGYCSSCQKEVVDFTQWSDNQVADYFKNRHQSTCGRLRKDQLKFYGPENIPGSSLKFVPLSIFGITLLLGSNRAEAAGKKAPGVEITSFSNVTARNHKTAVGDTSITRVITGIIKAEEDQMPMPGVNVALKDSEVAAVSDADGKFQIKIPNPKESDILVISFIGYEEQEKRVNEGNELFITLKLDTVALEETIVVGGICARRWSPRTIWWRVRNIFR
jgi:hypothetical protein